MRRCLHMLAAGLLLTTGHSLAGERQHTVQAGESVSSLARDYYGDMELGDLLLLYNGRSSTVIRVGEKLRIPFSDMHTVARGDSWSGIAQKYFDRVSVYPAVATLNGRSPQDPLSLGDRIRIPVVLSHVMEPGDSLAKLAGRYYGDVKLGNVLQVFNGIEDPRRLSIGQTINIPLLDFQLQGNRPVTPKKPVPVPKAEVPTQETATAAEDVKEPVVEAKQQPVARRFANETQKATTAYRNGDYAKARTVLEALRRPVQERGTDQDRAELWRLLTFVYVAFELPEQACQAHGSLVEIGGQETWDPDLVSPKIRETVSSC